jgi:hypothetical protein
MKSRPDLVICFTTSAALAIISGVVLSSPGGRVGIYLLMMISMIWPSITLAGKFRLLGLALATVAVLLMAYDWRAGRAWRSTLDKAKTMPATSISIRNEPSRTDFFVLIDGRLVQATATQRPNGRSYLMPSRTNAPWTRAPQTLAGRQDSADGCCRWRASATVVTLSCEVIPKRDGAACRS